MCVCVKRTRFQFFTFHVFIFILSCSSTSVIATLQTETRYARAFSFSFSEKLNKKKKKKESLPIPETRLVHFLFLCFLIYLSLFFDVVLFADTHTYDTEKSLNSLLSHSIILHLFHSPCTHTDCIKHTHSFVCLRH